VPQHKRTRGPVRRLVPVALGVTLIAAPLTAYATVSPGENRDPRTTVRSVVPAQEAAAKKKRPSGLDRPAKKEIAMKLVSSAENSTLDWRSQYGYIENIRDGRGYTAGIIGFCSGTWDMLQLVERFTKSKPRNPLAPFLPALRKVNGTDSTEGLGSAYVRAWKKAAADPDFRAAQNAERDRVYFNPAVKQAKRDGLGTLGQFIYYDAIVMHGNGSDRLSFGSIRKRALARAKAPAAGGDQRKYLNAYLDARVWAMKQEYAHRDTSRVDTAQRVFLNKPFKRKDGRTVKGNLNLDTPLEWKVYGDRYRIR
jgi:chitosanase